MVLVEPGPTGALNAKDRGVRTVVQSTLEDAGFAPESLPSVGLFDVVELIDNDAEFLRLIYSYLQPHGTLYVTVSAYNFLWSNDDVNAGHFRRYTITKLSSLLTECGFEIEYCSYLFSFLVPPLFSPLRPELDRSAQICLAGYDQERTHGGHRFGKLCSSKNPGLRTQ